ncbi:hypothetical protein LOTGIDRAFT_222053 [Lottia gigantea]|uniref:Protein PTHB1 n=1 Tax=Lottia gigantea TaxID=225164 RepID=V4B7H3_LOTGI|nr:hypothetical protein LOTGIDRAFT_222053 [Lottia gigantea]ESO84549.1 hypothetical protein LOTGIDRAFT_222053 [Lottia gigantea]
MSLFKTRDWWSVGVGEEEEFDFGCLTVGNIDNSSDDLGKYNLSQSDMTSHSIRYTHNTDSTTGIKAFDLLETVAMSDNGTSPSELCQARSVTESNQLAVLHPRKLAVYSIKAISGTVEHGQQYQIQLLYEHNLQRTTYNFCYGPFGGVKGKDFICVQSMDGTVSFFEQESFAFCRFLPGALLPGPISYIPRLDSFVIVSSSWQAESYKYQSLASAAESPGVNETQNIKSGKKVVADWTFSLGEPALDIYVMSGIQTSQQFFVFPGERNIFCLSEGGVLKYMSKMEYDPTCFCPYASLAEGTINYMVATTTNSLMVCQDVTLKWAAKLEHVPVQIKVANFQDLKGCIVTLSDDGHLQCSYLGTDPAIFIPPSTEARELNYQAMDLEMSKLQKKIREKAHKSVITPNLKTDDDLQLSVQANQQLDDISVSMIRTLDRDSLYYVFLFQITVKSKTLIENIQIDIHTNWPLASSQYSYEIPSLESGKSTELSVKYYIKGHSLPCNLVSEVTARYLNAVGAPRIVTAKVKLPLKLIVRPVYPMKNAEYKLTIDTNKPPVNLNDIFPDLLGENAGGAGAALGFQFFGGPTVTILASKTSQRYRIQCDQFEAMWLPLKELVERMSSYLNRGKSGDFKPSFDGSLPLQEYFELIEAHFEYRMNSVKCKEMLGQRSSQFRVIQRRLLTKFKDKTPSPLQNLDTLLEGTYRQLLALAEAIEDNDHAQNVTSNNLSSGTYLLNYLIKLWLDLSEEEFNILTAAITPRVNDNDQHGWEEMVDAAVTHLLRTVLAKTAKDTAINPSPLTIPNDTSKVKKHLALFCDRLGKGARLVEGLRGKNLVVQAPVSVSDINSSSGQMIWILP